jgi:hypothetical protein
MEGVEIHVLSRLQSHWAYPWSPPVFEGSLSQGEPNINQGSKKPVLKVRRHPNLK